MLRDDRQVALDQVIEALLDAGHAHEQGAQRLGADPDLAGTLHELTERRHRAAPALGDHVRRLGDLPSEPDADLQAARDVLTHVKVALADDTRDQVLEHCRQAEDHLAETVRAALATDLPADTRQALQDLLAVPELRALSC